MTDAISPVLDELERARQNVRRVSNRQVRSGDDRTALRATAMAWFGSHRPKVLHDADPTHLAAVDDAYRVILSGSDRSTTKKTYLDAMKAAKAALIDLRSHLVVLDRTADAAPDFSPFTPDAEMKGILERRWIECTKCVSAKAHMAAIVMMGGLLEALFVAKAKQLSDKSALFAAASAPKDDSGAQVPLNKWMLNSFLQVGYEVKWITKSARDTAGVLGEFRNYVHPEKEHRHRVTLDHQDSALLWGVTKNLVTQLVASRP